MRWFLDVAYIALSASYKWLLGITAVAGILVGALFAAGVLGGGDSEDDTPRIIPTRVPAATSRTSPTLVPAISTPTRQPTATAAPTAQPTPVPQASPTVPAPVVVERVQVPVLLQGAANVGSLEFVLTYDAAVLEAESVELGFLASGALLDFSTETPGALWVAMADANGMTGDGSVVLITFRVLDGNGPGSALELVDVAAFEATSLLDIITDAIPGTFTPTGGGVSSPTLEFVP